MSLWLSDHIFYICLIWLWMQFFWSIFIDQRQYGKSSKGGRLAIKGLPQFELWLQLAEKKSRTRMKDSIYQQISQQMILTILLFSMKPLWEVSMRGIIWMGLNE